jgi:hypothetical protein
MSDPYLKYRLYEASVQDAADDARIMADLYRRLRHKPARFFREDFCGTFKIASEWVKRGTQNHALALDIDPEPLAYGHETHYQKLSVSQQKRLRVLQKNVLSQTTKVDIIAALNFSYWTFKTRPLITQYFKSAFRSLKRDGLLILDVVGGTEMMGESVDRHTYGRGADRFVYEWRHESFNPINNHGLFSISFELKNKKRLRRAFTYDWRVWQIVELRECLREAGFRQSWVFWEQEDSQGEGNGVFRRAEKTKNSAVWIAILVASKI